MASGYVRGEFAPSDEKIPHNSILLAIYFRRAAVETCENTKTGMKIQVSTQYGWPTKIMGARAIESKVVGRRQQVIKV
jgi:hypothetical protein